MIDGSFIADSSTDIEGLWENYVFLIFTPFFRDMLSISDLFIIYSSNDWQNVETNEAF